MDDLYAGPALSQRQHSGTPPLLFSTFLGGQDTDTLHQKDPGHQGPPQTWKPGESYVSNAAAKSTALLSSIEPPTRRCRMGLTGYKVQLHELIIKVHNHNTLKPKPKVSCFQVKFGC